MILMKLVPVMPRTALTEEGWLYLKSFDVDAHNGRGSVKLTGNKADALRFADVGEAMAAWKRQSKVVPFRDDGKPNRPLTAYHATFETI